MTIASNDFEGNSCQRMTSNKPCPTCTTIGIIERKWVSHPATIGPMLNFNAGSNARGLKNATNVKISEMKISEFRILNVLKCMHER